MNDEFKKTIDHTFHVLDKYDPSTVVVDGILPGAPSVGPATAAAEDDPFVSAHGVGVDLTVIVTKQQLLIISDPGNANSPAITTDVTGEIVGFFYGKKQKMNVRGHSIAIYRSNNYKVLYIECTMDTTTATVPMMSRTTTSATFTTAATTAITTTTTTTTLQLQLQLQQHTQTKLIRGQAILF